jgi:2,5-diketo-D-gluconate reductase A
MQRGCSVIPKSEHGGRIKENIDLFGFSLSTQDMDEIAGIDQNLRMNDPGYFCPRNFNTQCPIWD